MNWSVLPVAGGLYDQDPKLLEQWEEIFNARNLHERQKANAPKYTPTEF